MKAVPKIRIHQANEAPVEHDGNFVLYWMIACRRTRWNFALDRALDWSRELDRPLVILEALRSDYPWASDRLHSFILNGMADNARDLQGKSVLYYPYVETAAGRGKGLLEAMAELACVVVTDEFPAFFLPKMVASAAARLPVRLEQIDSNGLLPMRSTERAFPSAYTFRRFLQKELPSHLFEHPKPNPFQDLKLRRPRALPEEIIRRWPTASELLEARPEQLTSLPLDHRVEVAERPGGMREAARVLDEFLEERLSKYNEFRNQPEEEATSGLSPYLHFGHVSPHHVFHKLTDKEEWFFDRLGADARGSRSGWWGMSESAEAFLDELVTWRELGFNTCLHRPDYAGYESLPHWSLETLRVHETDPRPHLYTLDQFERAQTDDTLWNAAQMQLVLEGRIENYLRMLWGKKILEWTPDPREALEVMIELNNKYALDGRDPNSYSGIFWVLGRYDRPWGPERPIFGKIRYMSSKNTARKLRVEGYIERYAPSRQDY